jgi:hypothetical protein
MSQIDRRVTLSVKAYPEPLIRDENGFSPLAPIHPLHPMQEMPTIRVGSLREMWSVAPIGITIPEQNAELDALAYALAPSDVSKPVMTIRAEIGSNQIIKIAATTTVPDEVAIVEKALDVVKGLVWRRIDWAEAILWFYMFSGASATLTPPRPVRSFRELFALARTFLSRMAPHFIFRALMRPIAYGAALLENSAGIAQNSNYTELQDASGSISLVPVAAEYAWGSFSPVIVYPNLLSSLCKRYIYETEFVERVVDESTEQNVYRITCERYLAPILPTFFYYNAEDKYIMPSVLIDASDAINAIASNYGPEALDNLEYTASVN